MVNLYSRSYVIIHNNELFKGGVSIIGHNYLYGCINIRLIDEHSMFESLENKAEYDAKLKKHNDSLICEIDGMIALFAEDKNGNQVSMDDLKNKNYIVMINDTMIAKELIKLIKVTEYDKVFTYFI